MSHSIKIIAINIAILGILVAGYFTFRTRHSASVAASEETASADSSGGVDSSSPEPDVGYVPDGKGGHRFQIIDPYELSKNPFRNKNQFGILDTGHMPLLGYGDTVRARTGERSIRFEHMLEDHLAMYSIMAAIDSLAGDQIDELAVKLTDNNPPDVSKPWLVMAEGTIEMTNGYGATIHVPIVRFVQYAELPAPPPPAPAPLPLPPPAPVTRLTPTTLPNGDIFLSDSSGCGATFTNVTVGVQAWVKVIFQDGTSNIFTASDKSGATDAVLKHCQGAH